jgi:2-amino-4-hydroxy-6-hydroxymethyldihydropteridine diphosphokinase
MPRVWLSLGSNLDRERSLRGGTRMLRARFGPLILSSVYESAAVGFAGEPFLNLVAGAHTALPPETVQGWLREIEDANGRVRGPDKFAPRTLDIDLLTYGEAVLPALRLPRDEILHHAFVLGPLAEVAPDECHPLDGRTYAALWAAFGPARDSLLRVPFAWD